MTRLVRLDQTGAPAFPPAVTASLLAGGMVIYPTDTLYGLGVDPNSREGLSRLVAAKEREGGKPIPLLLDRPDRASDFASHVPDDAARLMDRFWPGALTVVLSASGRVPPEVTGGGKTVGLRVPDHAVPRSLAAALGGAITGTSANRSGNPGIWRDAEEILREFTGEVDWVLWDGPPPAARPGAPPGGRFPGSTVVRVEDGGVVVLREGAIPVQDIFHALERG